MANCQKYMQIHNKSYSNAIYSKGYSAIIHVYLF
jgi:hypothetical protein